MRWSLATITGPAAAVVPLADAKAHLREDVADAANDALIARLIDAAYRYAEDHTGRKILAQAVRLTLDGFPGADCPIRLPGGVVSAVTAVKYRDTAGTPVTMAEGTDYRVWLDHAPPLVYPARQAVWPATDAGELRAVEVEYAAGEEAVPAAIQQAVLLIVGANYETRGDDRPADRLDIPPAAKRLLDTVSTGAYL